MEDFSERRVILADTIKMAGSSRLLISCFKLFTLMCSPMKNFSECRVIMAVSMVVIVFIIAHCLNRHNIAPHTTTATESFTMMSLLELLIAARNLARTVPSTCNYICNWVENF